MPARVGKSGVARDERHAKRFGQGKEGRVVRRHVVAQLPDAVGERLMRVSDDGQVVEVGAGVIGSRLADGAGSDQSTQDVQELHVDQVGRVDIGILAEPSHERRLPGTTQEGGSVAAIAL